MESGHHGLVGIGANIDCPGFSQLATRSVILHTRQDERYEHVVTVRRIHFLGVCTRVSLLSGLPAVLLSHTGGCKYLGLSIVELMELYIGFEPDL